jgi:hypothetical protein
MPMGDDSLEDFMEMDFSAAAERILDILPV